MRVIAFIEEPKVIDRIIRHLKLSFHAKRVRLGWASPTAGYPVRTSYGSRGDAKMLNLPSQFRLELV